MVWIERWALINANRINFPIPVKCIYPRECVGKIVNCTAAESADGITRDII